MMTYVLDMGDLNDTLYRKALGLLAMFPNVTVDRRNRVAEWPESETGATAVMEQYGYDVLMGKYDLKACGF